MSHSRGQGETLVPDYTRARGCVSDGVVHYKSLCKGSTLRGATAKIVRKYLFYGAEVEAANMRITCSAAAAPLSAAPSTLV